MENEILPSSRAKETAKAFYEEIHSTGTLNGTLPTTLLYEENGGAMFGFLICKTKTGEEVLLKAFSGKLSGSFIHSGFVPPCFSVTAFNALEAEYSPTLHDLTERIAQGDESCKEARTALMLECLEKTRKLYSFHDIAGKKHTFKEMGIVNPPTGTGDCATIKLLNTAFKKGYTLVSMAEMFIGNGKLEDGSFHPPCKSRCGLLLPHLIKLEVLYCDEDVLAINKPSGLLSTPGRGEDKYDSASVRVHALCPSSPLLPSVHRLDMDTSGVIVYALTEEAKRNLSMQFEKRETHKEYRAVVEGAVREEKGTIDKPMRLDVEHRPYQIVDFELGKSAITDFERLKVYRRDGRLVTLLRLLPRTGRTHQLRVHLASIGHPILGDRLYGENKNGERLLLHALSLTFTHPSTGERLTITAPCPF
jgi:pseudouridine synthase, RluA family